ncbi:MULTISPECIES: helix-turn-helix domain-containing protein [Butyricimonas]|jgi:transcriptional regulator with XRE-family HTH domain|uniref:helix-turn-helix domain-containing protein n=1 Tax=Butyricimonas TaxID=574697 RepID=UPI00242D594E|nr:MULTISPECIES: helix-turn-helix transcriptional regulator [Butyricimonas]MCI7295213.1 helix-turn-helix domain-containing protein [Butyricimonas virosa]MDY6217916.1 helix-turn-helix transcriptional regulator [Butyricimonas virosa]
MKTSIDKYIIQKVKEIRDAKGIKQDEINNKLGFSTGSGYIGGVESTGKAKYNLYHLNELAKILDCDIADFLPRPYQEENSLKEYRDYIAEARRKAKEEREKQKK